MAQTNPHDQYLITRIQTARPEQILVMLFDGGIRFLTQAREAYLGKRYDQGNESVNRAVAIIVELQSTLRTDAGDISNNLNAIYNWWVSRLMQAMLHRDPAIVDEVLGMWREFRDTWAQAAQLTQQNRAGAATGGGGGPSHAAR